MTKQTQTNIAKVIALCGRKGGVTLSDIQKRLDVSKVASTSLIADARRRGARIKYKKGADGAAGRYHV